MYIDCPYDIMPIKQAIVQDSRVGACPKCGNFEVTNEETQQTAGSNKKYVTAEAGWEKLDLSRLTYEIESAQKGLQEYEQELGNIIKKEEQLKREVQYIQEDIKRIQGYISETKNFINEGTVELNRRSQETT